MKMKAKIPALLLAIGALILTFASFAFYFIDPFANNGDINGIEDILMMPGIDSFIFMLFELVIPTLLIVTVLTYNGSTRTKIILTASYILLIIDKIFIMLRAFGEIVYVIINASEASPSTIINYLISVFIYILFIAAMSVGIVNVWTGLRNKVLTIISFAVGMLVPLYSFVAYGINTPVFFGSLSFFIWLQSMSSAILMMLIQGALFTICLPNRLRSKKDLEIQ